jgi:hypothetical protein
MKMIFELKKELEMISSMNDLLSDLVSSFIKNENQNRLSLGCKVEVIKPGPKFSEIGRIVKWDQYKKIWRVQFGETLATSGGYESEDLKIIHSGLEGIIDTKLGQNFIRSLEIKHHLINSDLPFELRNKDYVNIKIVKQYSIPQHFSAANEYCFIDFEIFGLPQVLRIKVHQDFLTTGPYLQLKISQNDIVEFHAISKEKYQNLE